jgi:hypothetical protein
MVPQFESFFYYQYLVTVKAQVFGLDIVKLIINNQRTDDQKYGDRKLKYHQKATQPAAFKTGCQLAL